MKILAMYLPQFHTVPENDSWWGVGYTDWDNARRTKSMYKGHYQPKEPLDDNYYDLSNPEVVKWQAELAKEYGINGFSIYHYWFKDSHKVLWKPAENILHNPEIDIEYCFTWANHDWYRRDKTKKGPGIKILEVDYGNKDEWKIHYEYLVDFFRDNRYIKIDNKPLFIFSNYYECYTLGGKGMAEYWNELARKDGFEGIYFVGMDSARTPEYREEIFTDSAIYASLDFVPGRIRDEIRNREDWIRAIKRLLIKWFPNIDFWNKHMSLVFDYDYFYRMLLNYPHEKNNWRNCLVNYDDTPRMGKGGIIAKDVTPEKFEKYLIEGMMRTKMEGQEFLFITAWNEWGEGNYLEPDKKYKYGWLEAVKNAREKCGI